MSFCTQDGEKELDLNYFRELALEFYLSDNASDLGNFINGQLKYDWTAAAEQMSPFTSTISFDTSPVHVIVTKLKGTELATVNALY